MSGSIVNNMSLVTKIYFPREALPVALNARSIPGFRYRCNLASVLILIFRYRFTQRVCCSCRSYWQPNSC
jgi:ABC-type polysaccharide/polyol phosphate export permease